MLRKLLLVGLISYGVYYYYHQNTMPVNESNLPQLEDTNVPPIQIVQEKDLIPVKDLPHSKNNNPLYDNMGNERVRIKHSFSTQVQKNWVSS